MAENDEGEKSGPKGNEWEVVSLVDSAYAAAPSPRLVNSVHESEGNLIEGNDAETSNAMFMSSHFVVSPTQHKNLPVEHECTEKCCKRGGECNAPQLLADEGCELKAKEEESMNIKELISDEIPGIQIFAEKGTTFSTSSADFKKETTFDKEQSIYSIAEFCSFQSEETLDNSDTVEDNVATEDTTELFDNSLDSGLSNSQKLVKEDQCQVADLPCEAWWKRHAVSLRAHAKETNAFWSIFIAAAFVGVVILGQKWQQENWQILHFRWQFGINDEVFRMGRVLNPISQLKAVIVGGHRRGAFIRGSTPAAR